MGKCKTLTKQFLIFFLVIISLMPCLNIHAKAYSFTPPFTIKSDAGIVMNLNTQSIIYEKNADKQEMPAHLTQIMTAIIVLENCNNIDATTITMTRNPVNYFMDYQQLDDIRYADIMTGDTLTVREYLYAMLLTSSCESAELLAEHFGDGKTQNFVAKMNEKAKEIGCTSTNFINPTGLYDQYQITTARDMLLITQYALNLPEFEEIATAKAFAPTSLNTKNHTVSSAWRWTHSNVMMDDTDHYYYEYAKGIKTGNLNTYGRNIITMATKDNMTYLVVLLKAPFTDSANELQFYHLEDAIKLFDWAFEKFSFITLIEPDEELAEVHVENSDENSYVLVKPEENCIMLWCNDVDSSAIQKSINLNENIQAPVKKGDVLGTLELRFSGDIVSTINLVSVNDVNRSFSKYNLSILKSFPSSSVFKISCLVAVSLLAIYIIICIISAYKCKQKIKAQTESIKIVPQAIRMETHQQKVWKRSSPVFYHKPEEENKSQKEKTKETVSSDKK
ncbi:MAG: D-alanyl-D-alanine carboxypeptidase [Ruminococcus sp.]|nr:D-alanyl-D-alanine carboxypeptidase [Ruminococcus sp.]